MTAKRPGRGVNAETHQAADGLPLWILPLGFTTPPISLNDRGHWAKKNRAVKAIRTAVWVRAKQLKARPVPHVHVTLHYVPKDRRTRDPDNLVGTLKPAIDALTAAGRDHGRVCVGLVPDDDPEHVSWSTPVIHDPDEHGPRLWLEVQALAAPPAYGDKPAP